MQKQVQFTAIRIVILEDLGSSYCLVKMLSGGQIQECHLIAATSTSCVSCECFRNLPSSNPVLHLQQGGPMQGQLWVCKTWGNPVMMN